MRQRKAKQSGNQQATSAWKLPGSQRDQTRASMTTEYQERFLPPRCHMAVISTSVQKDPYHPLKGTNADVTTFRSCYVTRKWIKNPPKAPQLPMPPKSRRRSSSAPQNPVRSVATQMASKVEDYKSVYQNDYPARKANKRQPYQRNDSLKINQGLAVSTSKGGRSHKHSVQVAVNSKPDPQEREPQPFESVTSYRSDYVIHPLQPRTRAYKPSTGLTLEHAVPPGPKGAWNINQEPFDKASKFFRQFKTWSLETKFHGQGKARRSSPPADHNRFLSTTHADYTAHKCQRTKPVLPSMHISEKSKEPFQATTTMKGDYKAWPTVRKTTFSACKPKPAESCKTNPKPFSLRPKMSETAVCTSSCNASQKPPCPAENGSFTRFERISTATEESRRYWTTSLDRGVTWPDGDMCEEPPEAHQGISCMVSSRN